MLVRQARDREIVPVKLDATFDAVDRKTVNRQQLLDQNLVFKRKSPGTQSQFLFRKGGNKKR